MEKINKFNNIERIIPQNVAWQTFSQTQILEFPKPVPQSPEEIKLLSLDEKLSLCGVLAKVSAYCKKCVPEKKISEVEKRFYCEIRYCANPICLVQRFVRNLETFKDIGRFQGLNSLWHFAIGFKAIPELEFKENFSKYKKRQEYVLARYWEKLRRSGIILQAIRVLDFSFKTEGMVYMHYHFACVPVGKQRIRSTLIKLHEVRKNMIKRMRIKTPFIFKDFGLSKKLAIFSYLSIRASGMYKYAMTNNPKYKYVQGDLAESIKNHKYILLKDVLTKEEYLNSFYNKAHFVTVGGLLRPPRHGSNITDSIPLECPIHGKLEKGEYRIEIIFEENLYTHPPPSNFDDIGNIEVIRVK